MRRRGDDEEKSVLRREDAYKFSFRGFFSNSFFLARSLCVLDLIHPFVSGRSGTRGAMVAESAASGWGAGGAYTILVMTWPLRGGESECEEDGGGKKHVVEEVKWGG